ncbi:MAG: rhomboid family intramembrane serine protease, partial [Planctomycetaceae bacterium]
GSYPRAKVVTRLPLIIIWQVVVLPASLFLGIWFVIQFLQGTMSVTVAQTTGVAWWAHIGGFAAGASAAWLLGKGGLLRPPSEAILPRTAGLGGARPPSGRRPW